MRKGIVIGGMVLGLLLGCNNGGEDPQKVFLKSVVSLGNEFLNIFTSFGEMAGSALGFKTDPQKSDVANYFKNIEKSLTTTKTNLQKIVSDMKEKGNPNASGVETAVNNLVTDTIDKIIKGAETASGAIGSDAGEKMGNVAKAGGAQSNGSPKDVDKLVEGIKGIVEVVLKGKGNAEAGDNNKSEDLAARSNNGATKLFASDNSGVNEANTKKLVADASKAVGAVTGADILQAIIKDNGNGAAAKLAKNDANNASNVAGVPAPKDAEVAGGIALRAMAKSGKFANSNDNDTTGVIASTIKGAAISAVTKALDTLTIAIRKTIDEGLKSVKDAMKINPNDTPVTTEAKNQ